ncbi:MAG: complex I NDUFA9 subunit family protein [Nitrospirae bacterium]|nr:MAG: complex I NDUFA9 subunit family protein [Nitrospirota bacterium]
MKVLVAGGTGFVGRNLIPHLLGRVGLVRVLVRDPEKAKALFVPEVELYRGDITEPESLRGACEGVDLVVHLVGIIIERGRYTFESVHVKGTEALVEEALRAGVKRFFYQSALGSSLGSPYKYLKTKAQAEEVVKDSGMDYLIFRPSLILGKGDGFSKNMISLIKSSPVVPLPGGGKTLFQPIFIDDWCRAFMVAAFSEGHWNRIYEFGGPEHLSYRQMVQAYMSQMGLRRPVVSMPLSLAKMALPFGRLAKLAGMRLPEVTGEQLSLLSQDNITDPEACQRHFGFQPRNFEEFLPEVLANQF